MLHKAEILANFHLEVLKRPAVSKRLFIDRIELKGTGCQCSGQALQCNQRVSMSVLVDLLTKTTLTRGRQRSMLIHRYADTVLVLM